MLSQRNLTQFLFATFPFETDTKWREEGLIVQLFILRMA